MYPQDRLLCGNAARLLTIGRMALAGGPPATLWDGERPVSTASLDTNDTIVFGRTAGNDAILSIVAALGVAEPATSLAEGKGDHRWADQLPSGNALLFTVWPDGGIENARIALASLETGEHRMVEGSSPRYAPSGHLLFVQESAL